MSPQNQEGKDWSAEGEARSAGVPEQQGRSAHRLHLELSGAASRRRQPPLARATRHLCTRATGTAKRVKTPDDQVWH